MGEIFGLCTNVCLYNTSPEEEPIVVHCVRIKTKVRNMNLCQFLDFGSFVKYIE